MPEDLVEEAVAAAEASRDAIDNRIYPGTYASDPTTRPDGSAIQSGDEYFSSADDLRRTYNGATWVASDINTANLAANSGASLVGHNQTTIAKAIDQLKQESYASGGLLQFWRKVRLLTGGTTTQIPVVSFGDSVSGYPWLGLFPMLSGAFGVAGCALGALATGASAPLVSLTGTATQNNGTTVPYDYTYWPTGIHVNVGAGDTAIYQVGGAVFTGTKFAVYYAKRAGGGTMTVDLLDAANVVQATSGVIDTNNATTDYGKYEFTVSAAARKLRVTGNAGNVIIVGTKFLNTDLSGMVYVGLNRGGLGLSDANTAAAAIWKGCVADIEPALATYSGREDDSTVESELTTFLTAYEAAYASTDWVLCGTYAWGTIGLGDFGLAQNLQPSYLENVAVKRAADAMGYAFFDAYALFRGPAILKETPSDVHLTTSDATQYSTAFMHALGFNRLFGSGSRAFADKHYALQQYQSAKYNIAGATPNDALAGDLKASGTRDVILDFDRNFTLRGAFLGTPVDLLYGQGTASVPGLIFRSHYNSNSIRNVTSYAADGEWGIAIDSTTRQFLLRGRIGSAVYQANIQLGDPGKDGSGNIDNSKGQGFRGRVYGSTDTAFTTLAEYSPGEFKLAHNTGTNELIISFAPVGGGALRTATLATV